MSFPVFLVWLASIHLILLRATPAPAGFFINCGAPKEFKDGDIKWLTDEGFIRSGEKRVLDTPDLLPILSTLRFFPNVSSRKDCYVFPVSKGGKYLVRTIYYYAGFDGGTHPPIFDQIVDGTEWSTVNTTNDYAQGLSTFYEIVVAASGKTLSICLSRNEHTTSSPFISALQVEPLPDSVYNATDFGENVLTAVARHSFGADNDTVGFPDDLFDRMWSAFIDLATPVVESHSNVSSEDFWNRPPLAIFNKGMTTSRGKSLALKWPPYPLPSASYYIALYFQDNRTPSPYSWRVFDVTINDKPFYHNLNVTALGVTVYSPNWPLSGQTTIMLTPKDDSPVGPVINAGEILQVLTHGGRTLTRDVIAMEELARSFDNPPADWTGDPCLPRQYSWTGVTCSTDVFARVMSLNLTGFGIIGTLSPSIAGLTAITHILLDNNRLKGSIPDLSPLKYLVVLHLANNQLTGKIPPTLGLLENLEELFLQNNHLEGAVPVNLKNRKEVTIQT